MKHFSIVAAASIACFACSAGEDTTADEPRGTQANEAPDAQADEALAAQAEKLRQILAEAPRLSGDVAPVEMIPPREGWELGMVSWIAAGDDGLIYLLQRGDQADPVIALDRTGRVVRSWGSGMYATPHSIRVDPDGNIWTADAKSSRVLKFAHDGTLLMEIAVGGQPEDCDGNFCGTTDVAFAPDGHVFIADGYRNARILEYTPDGQRVGEWGSPGTGPGEFRLPHSLAVDEDGIVYVADRENGRIQTFERDGTCWATSTQPASTASTGVETASSWSRRAWTGTPSSFACSAEGRPAFLSARLLDAPRATAADSPSRPEGRSNAMAHSPVPHREHQRAIEHVVKTAPDSVLEAVRCPRCATPIDVRAPSIVCSGCGKSYPRLGEIPVLLPEPERYLASCRRQLATLEENAGRTVRNIQQELEAADVLPVTRKRCGAMIDALQGQVADVRAILEPLLPDVASGLPLDDPSAEVPATMEFIPYLYRDWGWPPEQDGENERALSAVEGVLEGRGLGRTFVVGAEACRLAYDLHLRHPDAEIVVIDVDPLLFAAARSVAHGQPISIREANLEAGDMDHASREWLLKAPSVPVDEDRFHFILADGLEPPFAPGVWDTVVTPWFIDQGPADLRDFISTLYALLKPGGRWVNLGPLVYGPELPLALRFSREELFDLARRGGFQVDQWHAESGAYLVSKLNGRGKVEWVLAFQARRTRDGVVGLG